jgi:hypothetical protein
MDPQLNHISRDTVGMGTLDPRPDPSSPVVTGAMVPADPFFTQVSYIGAFSPNGDLWTAGWTALSQNGFTDVEEFNISNSVPESFTLSQNYPNPFNPTTTIEYSLTEPSNVSLTVTNILGQEVAVLVDGFRQAGTYQVNFEASELPTGVYIYTLKTGSYEVSKKMTLLK